MDTMLPTTPSRYKQLITTSLKVYRASLQQVLLLALFLSFVTFIPRFLSDIIGQDIFYNITPLSPLRLWLIVIDLGVTILFIALLWRIHCFLQNRHEPLIEDLQTGLKKILYVWLAAFIVTALIVSLLLILRAVLVVAHHYVSMQLDMLALFYLSLAFAAQFVLVTYAFILFIFVIPLLAIENNGIITSIERSIALVWNHPWRTLSVQFTPWLVYLLVILLVKYLLRIDVHLYFAGHKPHTFLSTVVNVIIFAFYSPWCAILLLVQLHDLELRHQQKPVTK